MNRIIYFLSFIILFFACQQNKPTTTEIHFETMGTYGTVKIVSDSLVDENALAEDIDSILLDINMGVSTYIDSSQISEYNRLNSYGYHIWSLSRVTSDIHFRLNVIKAQEIEEETNGYFTPRIKPLVDYYNVQGFNNIHSIDSLKVDSIVDCINSIDFSSDVDSNPCLQLDLSAIAKGYGVDAVAHYIDSLGYKNYMVEIGGEVVCKGVNEEGLAWHIGIEKPNEDAREIYQVVELNNKAMATSGNYRNFKVLESGQKVVHIINPKTGYPEISNLLSASIVANDCMTADAYATACMVMGVGTCFQFVLNHPELDCYLIYSDESGNLQQKYTKYFEGVLLK